MLRIILYWFRLVSHRNSRAKLLKINLLVNERLRKRHVGQKIGQRPVNQYAIPILVPSRSNKLWMYESAVRLLGDSVIPRGEVVGRNEEITCSFFCWRHYGHRRLIRLFGRHRQLNALLFQSAVFNAIIEVNTQACQHKLSMITVSLKIET